MAGIFDTGIFDTGIFDHPATGTIASATGSASGTGAATAFYPTPENLFPFSEQLDWGAAYDGIYIQRTAVTTAENSYAAPFGGTTADAIVEDTSNAAHTLFIELTGEPCQSKLDPTQWHTISVYVRRGSGTRNITVSFGTYSSGCYGGFDFDTGQFGYVVTDEAYWDVDTIYNEGTAYFGSENVGGGWYRIWIANKKPAITADGFNVSYALEGSTWLSTYLGNGTSSVVVWGQQVNAGIGPAAYIYKSEWGIGSASGTGSGTGASDSGETSANASSSGTGAASGVGTGIVSTVATASGTGASNVVGAATSSAIADASGTAAASGIGASTASTTASATATGAATGVAAATTAASAAASGSGAASGVGASTAESSASASGTGAGSATGTSTTISSSAASASGTGAASAVAADQPVQENLYPSSEYFFANSRSGIAITQDAATSPFGASTAESFLEQTASVAHYVSAYQPITAALSGISGPTDYTISFYIKSSASNRFIDFSFYTDVLFLQMRFRTSSQSLVNVGYSDADADQSSWNDPAYASSFGLTPGRTGFYTPYGCESIGSGWYRIWATIELEGIYLENPTVQFEFAKDLGSSSSSIYAGDGTSTFSIWGIQINEGLGPAAYIANQQYAIGFATGTGAASAVSDSTTIQSGAGAASGTGAATGVGTGLIPATGTASASGAGSGTASSTAAANFTADGSGQASAEGTGINSTVGSASGSGTASGSANTTAESGAAASGTGTAAAVGTVVLSSVGSADGTGTSSSTASAQGAAAGSAAATGAANAVGTGIIASAGSATGSGTADAVGATTADTVGSGSGAGTATAVATAITAVVGSASGTGSSDFAISGTAATEGTSAGSGTASAVGTGIQDAVGSASGTGAGTAVQSAISAAVATAAGSGVADAAGLAVLTGDSASSGTGLASGVAERLLSLFPDSTLAAGGWTTDTGGSDLHSAIDEGTANDTDYIKSSTTPANDACEIGFSAPQGNAGEEVIVEYRYGKNGAARVDLVVKLKQGATEIASWTHLDVPGSEITVSHSLSAGEISGITNFGDLSMEFIANEP